MEKVQRAYGNRSEKKYIRSCSIIIYMDKQGEIYSLTCNITNKKYIGQAVCYIGKKVHGSHGRWKKHIEEAYSLNDRCKALNNAIRKYGKHNFTLRIIKTCDQNQLNYYETKYIRQYNTLAPNGYNLRTGGSRGKHSEITIEKIKIAKSGVNNHMYGKHHSEASKKKISAGNKGKVRTKEYRENMSKCKGRRDEYKNLPMYIYYTKSRQSVGYVVKHHPKMTLTKKSFTNSKYSLEEKLNQAQVYIAALDLL